MSRHSPGHQGLPSGSSRAVGSFWGKECRSKSRGLCCLGSMCNSRFFVNTSCHVTVSSEMPQGLQNGLALQSTPHPPADPDSWVCHTPQVRCSAIPWASRMCCVLFHSLCHVLAVPSARTSCHLPPANVLIPLRLCSLLSAHTRSYLQPCTLLCQDQGWCC